MAGTVTTTETTHTSVKCCKFSWTSDALGAATGTSTHYYDGLVEALVTDPGATAPTDDYDVTITDANGIDILAGNGADRDTANTETVMRSDTTNLGAVCGSKLSLMVQNAGNAKQGDVYVYIR